MTDFPPNSAKARRPADGPQPGERPRVERVVSAEPRRRKRGLGRQVKETFIGGTARGAVEYVVTDVVVPTVKELMFEAFQSGMQKLIFGESRIRRGGAPTSYANVGRVNYQGMSTSTKPPTSGAAVSPQSRARGTFDEIIIASRIEAEEVLERMFDILSRYEVVLVADLYELTGIQTSHTDHRWGWNSLRGAKVVPIRGKGYLLDLPEPTQL
jgi:hypothetical protein